MNGDDEEIYIPPHSIEAEREVLGAIMLGAEKKALARVRKFLRPEHFYRKIHGIIYEACCSLDDDGETYDQLSVTHRLKTVGKLVAVGGREYLIGLIDPLFTTAFLESHARIVLDQWMRRTAWKSIQDARPQLTEAEHAADFLTGITSNLDEIKRVAIGGAGPTSLADLVREYFITMEDHAKRGIPSGYPNLDRLLNGFQPGELVVIAARPSMGKSSLMTCLALNGAIMATNPRKYKSTIFSLEMPKRLITERILCNIMNTSSYDLRKADSNLEVCDRLCAYATGDAIKDGYPIDVLDRTDDIDTVIKIGSHLRGMAAAGVLPDVIYIDHLQHISFDVTPSNNRNDEVGKITRYLKHLAIELNRTIIVLSQLSRGLEARQNKRPQMSDLRDSGNIEQDADVILAIYRDDYYNPETLNKGVAELLVLKNRSGATGTAYMDFDMVQNIFFSKQEGWSPVGGGDEETPTNGNGKPKYGFKKNKQHAEMN